jgi:coenzyme F420-dependent glucose-6-phosphate dehydrogenase
MIAKFAGRVADGFICTSGKAPELYSETLLPNVAAGLAGGRDAGFDRSHDRDEGLLRHRPERALEDTRFWAALSLSPEEKMSVEDPLEMEKLADNRAADRAAAKRWIVSNDPDEHVERIRPYVDLGFRHLVFHAPGRTSNASSGSIRNR